MAWVRCAAFLTLLVASTSATEVTARSSVTPIEKVIEMMNEMVAKGTKEKQDEEVAFAKFSSWCKSQQKFKTEDIAKANESIEKLKAEILKAEAEIKKLTDRINELEEDIGRWKKDQESATAVRNKERVDFQATQLDYGESVDALDGAIATLKKQPTDIAQSLLQLRSLKTMPQEAVSALDAFIQEEKGGKPDAAAMADDGMSFVEAPEAAAYENQSGGVIEMLEGLKKDFKKKKADLEKDEMIADAAFQKIMQQLTSNIDGASHEIDKKTATRAETMEAKAEAEGSLAQTTSDRDEDQTYLDDTIALCDQKTSDFEARQKMRAEELDAINKAIEIISGGAVAGAGEKHLPSLLQISQKRTPSFAQLRSSQDSPIQAQVAAFLQDRARSSGSKLLAAIAERVEADPFKKVKKMIKDLINKLTEEATAEAEAKGWCDTEMTTNKQTRDNKSEDVASLTAEIEDLTSEIAQLTQLIEDLTAALKELDTAMAESTEDRLAAKEKNEQTIQEAKDAQVAVEEATKVLKDFYAKSAQATALAQIDQPAADAPETFDKPAQGQQAAGGNVISFLEVILSDFARLEEETTAQEATEVEEYDKFMFESKKDTALKANEKKHAEEKKTDKESALHSAQEELTVTQDELDKAMAYFDKLKPTCVDTGISYEERVKRREEEIQSLSEALKILSGTGI